MPKINFIRRRRQYIVKRGMQFRYIGLIFALLLFVFSVAGVTVFITGWTLFTDRLADVYPQGRLLYVLKGINMSLIRNILAVSPVVFLLGVLFSHKIAGPVLNIERSMSEIGEGDLTKRISLRSGDELWDLAYILNNAVENIDGVMGSNKEAVLSLKKKTEEMKKEMVKDAPDFALVQSLIIDFESELKAFETSLEKWMTTTRA